MLPELADLSYREKMDWQELFSLEWRRLRGDLIQAYKLMRGMDKVNACRFFPRVEDSKTRWHRRKVRRGRINRDLRGNFYSESSLYLE